jgi:hypothetical protein
VNQGDRGASDKHCDNDKTLLPDTPSGASAWRQQMGATDVWLLQFTGDKFVKRQKLMPHISKYSNPHSVFFHFAAVITLLVEEISCYCQQKLDTQAVDFLQYLTWLNLKCFFFWRILLKWGLTDEKT